MDRKVYLLLLSVLFLVSPLITEAQRGAPWRTTVTLKDRLEGGQTPDVARVTLSAYYLNSRVSPGAPIPTIDGIRADTIRFSKRPDGYIKFRFDNIKWMFDQLEDVASEADLTPEYKVVVRSLWVDMSPQVYLDAEVKRRNPGFTVNRLRRTYITAPNVEYIYGDSMPPPIIFKVDQNNNYRFLIGIKAVTPETGQEKQFVYPFDFIVDGLVRNGKGFRDVKEVQEITPPKFETKKDTVKEVEEVVDNREIDAAVKRAIEEEDDNALVLLMQDHPTVPSVIEAREYLSIQMSRELLDSMKYRVDIIYEKFTRTKPRRSQIGLSFKLNGRDLAQNSWPSYYWEEDQLFVTPPRDSQNYTITAQHLQAREHTANITLNSVADFINLSYRDTLDGEFISLNVTGGKRPFMLHLERKGGLDFFNVDGALKIYGDTVLKKSRLARSFGLSEEGDYRIFVEDSDQLKKTGTNVVHIVPPPPIPVEVWYASAGGLFLFFIGFLIWKREQNRKDGEMEKLLAARGGKDPRVKRKAKPDLKNFWKETAISDLSLHKNFIREVGTYLRERQATPEQETMIEGVILGTVIKFDFENEQYEVRLDRFRPVTPRELDHYDDKPNLEKWSEIRYVTENQRDLVRIGWLEVSDDGEMKLGDIENEFQDEQFSELFQLMLKINVTEKSREMAFFTRTTGGKMNNADDRKNPEAGWMNWDELESAGYIENEEKPIRTSSGELVSMPEPHIDAGQP